MSGSFIILRFAQRLSLAYHLPLPIKDGYAQSIKHAISYPLTNALSHSHQNAQLHCHAQLHLHPQPFSLLDPQQICDPLALQSAHANAHEVGHAFGLYLVQPFADRLGDRHPIEDCHAHPLSQLHATLVELAFPYLSTLKKTQLCPAYTKSK
ncbi:uncharacterized protein ACA1_377880 [Acanthamoeba castellanii str. Neff]|uniref:Uncharacterized protein n=1 Tax=Acanthamoeba castellanii (strain ATCC 30010 / Neff) TaxID=1257118 RepID=L8GSV6_ACACF|nr:uncharacterized protein ACA1_377880 [Acanthamoeba castellanii str. Neff]ELR15673.1 hypothetical protein ACA1_377880 [Acanthamoeba castellanii str. Neff]